MENILKEINQITNVKIEGFKDLFNEKNEMFLEKYKLLHLKRGTRFVAVEEDVNFAWLLISGQVKALEEYYTGDTYTFTRFVAPEVFGEMEALANINKYRATLITETECSFLTMPIDIYIKILQNNSEYLFQRTQAILKRVLDDKKHMRAFLMIKSIDRIRIYFTEQYNLGKKDNKTCSLRISRQQIAEEIGYSVKTINRGIKKLEEQNLLKVQGQRIIITETQYKKMKDGIESFVDL